MISNQIVKHKTIELLIFYKARNASRFTPQDGKTSYNHSFDEYTIFNTKTAIVRFLPVLQKVRLKLWTHHDQQIAQRSTIIIFTSQIFMWYTSTSTKHTKNTSRTPQMALVSFKTPPIAWHNRPTLMTYSRILQLADTHTRQKHVSLVLISFSCNFLTFWPLHC